MSLAKQLYIIISFLFLAIFVGNFTITVQNTKEYLEEESYVKAQDTATSLGLLLSKYISDKNDAEISLIIKAVSDRGFYKEVKLVDDFYTFDDGDLLQSLDRENVSISNVRIDPRLGKLIDNNDNTLENELQQLENESFDELSSEKKQSFTFEPSSSFQNGDKILVTFDYKKDNKSATLSQEIVLTNLIYKTFRDEQFDNVPSWFMDMIQIKLKEAKSEINDGWKTSAIIHITPNAGIAYSKLYEQVVSTLTYSLLAFIISLILLAGFLKLILTPLKEIEELANKITKGSFEQIEDIPWTKELKNVSLAINKMSEKIKDIITKLNDNVNEVTKKLSEDNLTGLQLKQSFQTDMKEMFLTKNDGYLFIVRIDDLAQISTINGRNMVNDFIVEFANKLKAVENSIAYRFVGSEFALLVKGIDETGAQNLSLELQSQYEELAKTINRESIVHMGAMPFDQFTSLGDLLSGATEAYEMAKQIGPNEFYIKEKDTLSRGLLEWKELVFDVIDNDKINIDYIGDIVDINSDKLLLQEAFAKIVDNNNETVPIGIFISVATEHQKIIEFDKNIVNRIVSYMTTNSIEHNIAINLSIESMLDGNFIAWLCNLLDENKDIANKIVFSLTSYVVASHIDDFTRFVQLMKKFGSGVMIKRFESKFIDADNLKVIKPTCIRLAREYTQDICNDRAKTALVDSISQICDILDIQLFGENICDRDMETIKKLCFCGINKQ
jgi:EAL domain-containing protein (putative c-di-GMP-specific phosphodiesterase class I)